MFKAFLFSDFPFDSEEKARRLLDYMENSIFPPAYFGTAEPIRQKYVVANLEKALQYLYSGENRHYGELFLKSNKAKFLIWITWGEDEISQWYLELEETFFSTQQHVDQFTQ